MKMTGAPASTAAASSGSENWKPPSPERQTTVASGTASAAPIAAGGP